MLSLFQVQELMSVDMPLFLGPVSRSGFLLLLVLLQNWVEDTLPIMLKSTGHCAVPMTLMAPPTNLGWVALFVWWICDCKSSGRYTLPAVSSFDVRPSLAMRNSLRLVGTPLAVIRELTGFCYALVCFCLGTQREVKHLALPLLVTSSRVWLVCR